MIFKCAPTFQQKVFSVKESVICYGYHLQQCPSGGGYFVGHNPVAVLEHSG